MLRSVFLLFCASFWYFNNVAEVRTEHALLYSLKKITKSLDETETPCLTACPATRKTEMKFNDEVSISGKCLFLRDFYQIHDLPNDLQLDICDKPYQPVVIYNTKRDKYNIGYELYYYENKNVDIPSVYEHFYDRYRSVNVTSYDKITHSTKPQNNFFQKLVDGTSTKFKREDDYGTLVFHWITVFIVDYSMYKRIIMLSYNAHINDDLQHDLDSTCDAFNLEEDQMNGFFNEKNQETSLKDLLVTIRQPPPTTTTTMAPTDPYLLSEETTPDDIIKDILISDEIEPTVALKTSPQTIVPIKTSQSPEPSTPPPISCGQVYGCFVKSQVVPLWYFRSRSTRLASCMTMNTIPVWKAIANSQLKKVDRNIVETLNGWRKDLGFSDDHKFGNIIYGTWSWLKLPTRTSPDRPQPVWLSDPELNQTIPVPRIIYRIVSVWWRGVAIIIHNDRSPISQIERLCDAKSRVSGWEKLTNEDWTTGLTYTCRLTQDLDHKLGGNVFKPERYKSVLYGSPEHSQALKGEYQEIHVKNQYIQ